MFAGTQLLGGDFAPAKQEDHEQPLVASTAKLNVFVCSACFHVSRFLSEDDRNALIRTVSGQ
ncbi:hypothetical protein D1872_287850 [compost metagenome]